MGFAELVLVAVVGLLVLGPERLPGAIRTLSLWLGRLRRSFNAIRREIEQEIGADEIRRQLHNEQILENLERAKRDSEAAMEQVRSDIYDIEEQVNSPAESDKQELQHDKKAP